MKHVIEYKSTIKTQKARFHKALGVTFLKTNNWIKREKMYYTRRKPARGFLYFTPAVGEKKEAKCSHFADP